MASKAKPEVNAMSADEKKKAQAQLVAQGFSPADANKTLLLGQQGKLDVNTVLQNTAPVVASTPAVTPLQADIAAGKAFGQEIIGKGLGRLQGNANIENLRSALTAQTTARQKQAVAAPTIAQTKLSQQTLDKLGNVREANIAPVGTLDAIQRGQEQGYVGQAYGAMQNIANQGLSRQELQAEREALTQQLQRAQQTASRTAMAQQGASGIQGAVAGRQLMDINMQAAQQRGNIARDLFLRSEQLKREGTQNVANLAMQRQASEDQRNQAFQSLNLNRGTTLLQAQQARSIQENQLNQARDISLMQAGQQRSQAQANLNAQRELNQANLDMSRVTANENLFQGRQAAYEGALQSRLGAESAIQTFDLGQASKEKNLLLQAGLGFGALGAAERGSQAAAQASAQAAAAQSSGGGLSVICTELARQNLLTGEMLFKDQEYGHNTILTRPHIYVGYLTWAQYVVKGMRKSTFFTKSVYFIVKPALNHIAYNNSKVGKITLLLGEIVCGIIGKVVGLTNFKMSKLFGV